MIANRTILIICSLALTICAWTACNLSQPKPAPVILVASVELQQHPVNSRLFWSEFKRNGKLRRSSDPSEPEHASYMNAEELKLEETDIVEIWKSATETVIQNADLWSTPASWPGPGYEQLNITFCHELLGWQNLTLTWPIGEKPTAKKTATLLDLLHSSLNSGAEPTLKTVDLLR